MESSAGIYVFEGIDNVGKTTIIQALKNKINETTKYNCFDFAFPGHEQRTLGSLVYNIHHHEEQYFDAPINEVSLQLLHIAAHIDLIENRLKMLNNQKSIILLDRFWWSTYVYGFAGGLKEDMLRTIIAPELMFWEDLDIRNIFLIERSERKRDFDIKKEAIIIEKYRELANTETKCILLSNDESLKEIVSKIYNTISGEEIL